jgi:hypothetical protein
VSVGIERFLGPEAVFNPAVVGHEYKGLAHHIEAAISGVEPSVRDEIASNIILSGGIKNICTNLPLDRILQTSKF